MGFSRQEYRRGLPCPPPGDLPNLGIEPRSPTLWADSLLSEPPGKPKKIGVGNLSLLKGIFLTQASNWGFLHYRQIFTSLATRKAHFLLSVQFCSVAQSCLTFCNPMDCSRPGFPVLHQLPELTQTHIHWVSDVIQPSHPLSSPSPPAFNLSQNQGLFKWVGSSHQVAREWNFSYSISPSNEYSGLISFRMDWLDLLAVQGTLKSLLQHHSSKPSILWFLAFFIVQLSNPYMTTGKTIVLSKWTTKLLLCWQSNVSAF